MKRLFRLKRKTGAVLFAVVCVMALLITMATTAYYTARSAYNSVVSNYNYSQLYLSAISVADMVSSAVMNDSLPAATGTSQNDFEQLRKAITDMDAVGEKIHARTNNIPAADVGDDQAVISTLESQQSVIDGVLDGVVVEAEVAKLDVTVSYFGNYTDPNNPTNTKDCDKYDLDFTYKFTTTAYYRNNSITVEDIVTVRQTKYIDKGSRTSNTQSVFNSNSNPDSPDFNTFLTATGQGIVDGKPGFPSRAVKIKTHEITDDAFYQNDKTFFVAGNDNLFRGGLSTTGDLYLQKITLKDEENGGRHSFDKGDGNGGKKVYGDASTYNDWFVGGDLVITESRANDLNLLNNNLYVKEDLVIGADASITAEDIYVEGDLYILGNGQSTIYGNLHVTGNIYYQMDATQGSKTAADIADDNGCGFASTAKTDMAGAFNIKQNPYTSNVTGTMSVGVTSGDETRGNIILADGVTSDARFNIGDKTYYVSGNTSATATKTDQGTPVPGIITTYNSDEVKNLTIASKVEDSTNDKYDPSLMKDMSLNGYTDVNGEKVNGVYDIKGENQTYSNYTAKQETYDNKVDIDFSKLVEVDKNGNPPTAESPAHHYEANFSGITVKTSGTALDAGTVTIDIPFKENGYCLDISNFPNGSLDAVYNIGTDSTPDANGKYTTMPIVLMDNMESELQNADGTKTKVPGFSWDGVHTGNGNEVQVFAAPTDSSGNILKNPDGTLADHNINNMGNIIFEMGNYNSATNKYEPYNPANNGTSSSVVYNAGQKVSVGTKAQLDKIGTDGIMTDADYAAMTTNGVPNTTPVDYNSKFMLISNADGKTAVNASMINNVFCGYVYAPNGKYDIYGSDGGKNPIFGGMIVSNYDIELADFYYAEPKPSMIANTIGALNKWGAENSDPSVTESFIITETDIPSSGQVGSNIIADWDLVGSNYVG